MNYHIIGFVFFTLVASVMLLMGGKMVFWSAGSDRDLDRVRMGVDMFVGYIHGIGLCVGIAGMIYTARLVMQ